jgi:exodeoxyribonuclease V beta subunit
MSAAKRSRNAAASFDPAAVPLEAANLIEANAGTGKTWTITALYVRLVLETGFDVESVLVVTFTEAATGELRDRIRARLAATRDAFERGAAQPGDAFTAALLERTADRGDAIRRLTAALTGFDQAPVYTIHGFCQRALADQAFESGMPFKSEIVPDQSALLREIVDDFWRREVHSASSLYMRYLIARGIAPDALREEIARFVGKPYLHPLPDGGPADLGKLERAHEKACAQARSLWLAERETIAKKLVGNTSLHGNQYRQTSIPGWLDEMHACLAPAAPRLELCKPFGKFTTATLAAATRAGAKPPAHAFFDACETLSATHAALVAAYDREIALMKVRLLGYCNEELAKRKAARQLQSYDDMLLNLDAALHAERGADLARTLRARYQAALIDEFQDTDPVQYSIFREIYGGSAHPVFFVGDPKQSIYSFRGADVYTYFHARGDAGRTHPLAVNWRTNAPLLDAVNKVFSAAPEPFVIGDIGFAPSSAAHGDRGRLEIDDDAAGPLDIWFVQAGADGKPRKKTDMRSDAAEATAAEIARLLNLGAQRKAWIVTPEERRELRGGDIAVLVRSHLEGDMVRQALARCGVSAVQRGSKSVFDTPEAEALERLLAAIAEPGRESLVGAALCTDLIGMTGDALHEIRSDEQRWEAQMELFRDAHREWRERGFMAMLRSFFARREVLLRVLGYTDGERRATNLLQLAELLHCEAGHSGIGGLLAWFSAKRRMPEQANEAELLRLESDENLVKILTVHVSKGLEFPVTFCPFVWDGDVKSADPRRKVLAFHDPEHDGRATVDFGSAEFDAARAQAVLEERAENVRLLYVALTRAKYRCTIVWGHIASANTAAFAWLAHRGAAGDVDFSDPRRDLERLAARAEGGISIRDFPTPAPMRYQPDAAPAVTLAARHFARALRDVRRTTSFTALAHGRSIDTPDYDAADREPLSESVSGRDIFAFPRGAQAGKCIHTIFENVDFAQLVRPELERVVEKALAAHGFDPVWTRALSDMVESVIAAPLDESGLRLAGITRDRRLDELEFYYPLAHITDEGLKRVLGRGGFPDEIRERIGALTFAPARGYMTGFIDLVFEQTGRYYLADYKSNWLGATPSAYGNSDLARAMGREAYYLQYLVYCVALHRYLRSRVAGYAYESHFGGVRYLFVRGMRADARYGVFEDRPSASLIEALDAYFTTGSAA